MFISRVRVSAPLLSCIICITFLTLYNFTFWQQMHLRTTLPFMAISGAGVATIMYAFLTIFSFKYTYKPFLILAFFMGAISAYSMDNYGYVVSVEAFRNVIETDGSEALDLFHWHLLRDLLLFFVIPAICITFVKINYPTTRVRLVHLLLCTILFVANLSFFGKYYSSFIRNHRQLKYYINPVRPIYSLLKYTGAQLKSQLAKDFLEIDATPTRGIASHKPKLIVLVLGESDRAINHQINGYHKPTNPRLSLRDDLFSFKNVKSCGTETTVSVPCMFSVYKREDYNDHKGRYTENVLDLLSKAQVQVLWRDNDGGCKHVCNRVETHDLNEAKIEPFCNGNECHDEVLLHNLQEYIQTSSGDKLIVLHKKGNHGPAYYKRYPQNFAQFMPTCNTNELHKCTSEQIVNTYDNIILYTDYFLDAVIKQLEQNTKYQTALLYLSDHGESLGEKGIYLHAMPYWLAPQEQTHVPFMFWASHDFEVDRTHVANIVHNDYSHDHLFHTLLGLFKVQSKVYLPEMDMFATA